MRCVMTRVLPLPGPARMSTAPSPCVTASRCASFSPSRSSAWEATVSTGASLAFAHSAYPFQLRPNLIGALWYLGWAARRPEGDLRMFLITWPGGSWEATLRYGIIIALIFLAVFWIAIVFWTYRDIRQRTRDPVLQTAAVILVLIFNFPGPLDLPDRAPAPDAERAVRALARRRGAAPGTRRPESLPDLQAAS